MDKLRSEPIYITLEEFEKVLTHCCFNNLLITPVLQVWNGVAIGNYKATGHLIVSGVCERDFLVVSYIAEGIEQENIDYEKDKFLELINLSFVRPLMEKGMIGSNIIIEEVIVK